MTRFAWLQSRTQTLVAAGLLVALPIAAAITGIQLSHLFHHDVAGCTTGCGLAINQFLSHGTFMDHMLDILGRAVPALLGLFWGATLLAREFETGTYRLAWTQSVSRSRWLITKLAVGVFATLVLAGLLTLTVTWWYRSRDQIGGANPYAVFDRRDIAPIAYAAFAFASGALIGAIVRRTVPAMAATLAVFVGVRVAVSIWVRPHLLTPVHEFMSLAGAGPTSLVQLGIGSSNGGPLQLFVQGQGPSRSWTLSSHLVSGSGQRVSSAQVAEFLRQHCANVTIPPAPGPNGGVPQSGVAGDADQARACLAQVAQRFRLLVRYQPGDRYWTFQWLETAIFTALTLLAAGGCYWWVTRRAN